MYVYSKTLYEIMKVYSADVLFLLIMFMKVLKIHSSIYVLNEYSTFYIYIFPLSKFLTHIVYIVYQNLYYYYFYYYYYYY